MPFVTIPPTSYQVGDPITAELISTIVENGNDLDSRVTTLSAGSGIISFFNCMIDIWTTGKTKIEYFRVPRNCIVSSFIISIADKATATSGILSLDLKKSTTLVDASFNSVLTTLPSINLAIEPNGYSESGVINTSLQLLNEGDWIRLDLVSLPVGLRRFHVYAIGEF